MYSVAPLFANSAFVKDYLLNSWVIGLIMGRALNILEWYGKVCLDEH